MTEILVVHDEAFEMETVRASIFPSLLRIALSALAAVRPFIKMNSEQSAAFGIVIGLLGGGPAT